MLSKCPCEKSRIRFYFLIRNLSKPTFLDDEIFETRENCLECNSPKWSFIQSVVVKVSVMYFTIYRVTRSLYSFTRHASKRNIPSDLDRSRLIWREALERNPRQCVVILPGTKAPTMGRARRVKVKSSHGFPVRLRDKRNCCPRATPCPKEDENSGFLELVTWNPRKDVTLRKIVYEAKGRSEFDISMATVSFFNFFFLFSFLFLIFFLSSLVRLRRKISISACSWQGTIE